MKKVVSVILILAIFVMCCSCSRLHPNDDENAQETERQMQIKAEEFAENYLRHLFHAEFKETELLVAFTTEKFVTEFSKKYPQDMSYDGDIVEIEGETFESVEKLIEAAEEKFATVTLDRIEKIETKSMSAEELKDNLTGFELAEALIDTVDANALSTLISVDFDVAIKIGEKTREGRVSVWMINQNREWKVISPTWIGWLLLGYDPFK